MQPKNWVNLDKQDNGQEYVYDILEVGIPMPDNTFDFVLMNHVLQTFTYNEHEAVLEEVRRVMKPEAILRILVPDLEKALEAYRTANWEYFPISEKLEVTFDGKFARYLFWHGETRCTFTGQSLADLLKRNGFSKIIPTMFGNCELDTREEESLVMEAMK